MECKTEWKELRENPCPALFSKVLSLLLVKKIQIQGCRQCPQIIHEIGNVLNLSGRSCHLDLTPHSCNYIQGNVWQKEGSIKDQILGHCTTRSAKNAGNQITVQSPNIIFLLLQVETDVYLCKEKSCNECWMIFKTNPIKLYNVYIQIWAHACLWEMVCSAPQTNPCYLSCSKK